MMRFLSGTLKRSRSVCQVACYQYPPAAERFDSTSSGLTSQNDATVGKAIDRQALDLTGPGRNDQAVIATGQRAIQLDDRLARESRLCCAVDHNRTGYLRQRKGGRGLDGERVGAAVVM